MVGFGGMGDTFFGIFPIIFGIVFILIIGVFLTVFIRGITEWNNNNHSPRLTVDAEVVAKRTNVSHHNSTETTGMSTSSTSYYVTFQVESGDRMELHVTGQEYGMLAEGDFGKLTFQGTRYLGFERR